MDLLERAGKRRVCEDVPCKRGHRRAQKERLLAKSLFLRLSIGTPSEAQ
jgi:hypothetical protein